MLSCFPFPLGFVGLSMTFPLLPSVLGLAWRQGEGEVHSHLSRRQWRLMILRTLILLAFPSSLQNEALGGGEEEGEEEGGFL